MRIGVDVGGTTVKIGFIDNYEIKHSYQIETTKDTLFDDVCKSISDYQKNNNIEIEAIGFGIPGVVKDNFIINMPNIGITNFDLEKKVSNYFPNIKIKSCNDANAAALGEALCDDEKPESSYMITLGTGVGGGFVLNGKVLDGAHSACAEIGHMYIDHRHEFLCSCGLKGCLETVASATGIVRLAKTYYKEYKTSLKEDDFTAKDVFDKAKENDPLCSFVFDEVSKYLARGIANIACTTDVDVFYIGGGVAACGQILIDSIVKYYKKYCHFALVDTKIKLARLGNKAGMLGAAYL